MGGMMGTLGFWMCMQHGFIAYFWHGKKYLDSEKALKNGKWDFVNQSLRI